MALTDNLISFWDMTESSGNATDSHGSNTLTDNNGVGSGRSFLSSSSKYLSHADNADLSFGDEDFSFCLRMSGATGFGTNYPMLISKRTLSSTNADYVLYLQYPNREPIWAVYPASGSGSPSFAIWGSVLSASTDYSIFCGHSASANEIWISVNAATPVVTSHSGGVYDGTGTFYIGGEQPRSEYYSGNINTVGMWGRDIRSDLTTLYNGGDLLTYAELGGGSFTLTAAQGTFTETGNAAGLLYGRRLDAAQGSYIYTGNDAGLYRGYPLTAGSGSFSLTGNDASLLYGRLISANTGAFTYTGNDAGLLWGHVLTAAQGSYTLTGNDVNLVYTPIGGYILSADSGSFSLTGNDASLFLGRKLVADTGTFTLTGNAAELLRGFLLTASQGTYNLTGNDVSLLYGRRLDAATGSFTFTGNDILHLYNRLLAAGAGSYILDGNSAVLTYSGEVVTERIVRILIQTMWAPLGLTDREGVTLTDYNGVILDD